MTLCPKCTARAKREIKRIAEEIIEADYKIEYPHSEWDEQRGIRRLFKVELKKEGK